MYIARHPCDSWLQRFTPTYRAALADRKGDQKGYVTVVDLVYTAEGQERSVVEFDSPVKPFQEANAAEWDGHYFGAAHCHIVASRKTHICP